LLLNEHSTHFIGDGIYGTSSSQSKGLLFILPLASLFTSNYSSTHVKGKNFEVRIICNVGHQWHGIQGVFHLWNYSSGYIIFNEPTWYEKLKLEVGCVGMYTLQHYCKLKDWCYFMNVREWAWASYCERWIFLIYFIHVRGHVVRSHVLWQILLMWRNIFSQEWIFFNVINEFTWPCHMPFCESNLQQIKCLKCI